MKLYFSALILVLGLSLSTQVSSGDETYGDGVAAYSLQNFEKARAIWLRLANEGDNRAIFRLADLYARGLGGAKEPEMAAKYYCQAAESDHAESTYFCARGKKESGQGGIEEYIKSADLGYRRAQYDLANFYVSGDGVEKDYVAAYRLYKAVSATNADDQLGKLAVQMMQALDPVVNKP